MDQIGKSDDWCRECGAPQGVHNATCSISIKERNDTIDRLTAEKKGWRCFICDTVFTTRQAAQDHFASKVRAQLASARREAREEAARLAEKCKPTFRDLHELPDRIRSLSPTEDK